MRDVKSSALVATVLVMGVVGLGGCATKKFVREQVAVVDTRVTEVGTTVTQHETRIADLDRTTREAMERAMAAQKLAEGKFVYEMVLSDDQVKFPVNHAELSPEAQARLGEFATRLKGENRNIYIEIQGHTDASGPTNYNMQLGEERAEAVRRYLNQQGVPLNRMASISYGEAVPVAPNNDTTGRAQNRRVVVIVMA
jgi:outer membrane protein OmpA-like peptidoglycan-associated protein